MFPEMFEGVLGSSMLWKAQDKKLVEYQLINLRDFGLNSRKTVDDTPYGGGDGMLLKVEPLVAAIEFAKTKAPSARVVLLTPRGKTFTQRKAQDYAKLDGIVLVCARYEGYDERVVKFVDEQISIGNYVLTGGELPAMVIADAVTRLIPGVLGGGMSAELESFTDGATREHPHYTRPEVFRGQKVPKVLVSGNHKAIEQWRQRNSGK